jgi:hypothetical protein
MGTGVPPNHLQIPFQYTRMTDEETLTLERYQGLSLKYQHPK